MSFYLIPPDPPDIEEMLTEMTGGSLELKNCSIEEAVGAFARNGGGGGGRCFFLCLAIRVFFFCIIYYYIVFLYIQK